MDNPLLLLDQIRTAPTEEAWEHILRLVMHGKLSSYIEAHYGAVEDMVLTVLENSREKALADIYFHEALERVFASLDLLTLTNDNAREAVLRLLQTFRPLREPTRRAFLYRQTSLECTSSILHSERRRPEETASLQELRAILGRELGCGSNSSSRVPSIAGTR